MKRRWIKIGVGAGAGITTIIGFFTILTMIYGFEIIDLTGDITCIGTYEYPCISEFKVRNYNPYVVDIYSSDQIKLDFSPDIKDYGLYVPDGRCKRDGFSSSKPSNSCGCIISEGSYYQKGWRCVDFTNRTKPRKDKVYNFRFKQYYSTLFRLVAFKEDLNVPIKWGFGVQDDAYLDPLWDSDNFSYEYICTPYTINETRYRTKYRLVNRTQYGLCIDINSSNGTVTCQLSDMIINQSYRTSRVIEVTKKKCVRDKIRVGRNWKLDYKQFGHCFPDRPNRRVCCVSANDGNNDDIIQPGETFDCTDIYGNKKIGYSSMVTNPVERIPR